VTLTIRLEGILGWERLPSELSHRDVAAVAVDRDDRVYLATRVRSCIFVYQRDGTFVRTWGEGMFSDRLHGLTMDPDGTLLVVDDAGHSVRRFTTDGEELGAIGPVGTPSETGYDGSHAASIQRAAGPYNRPTNVAVAPNGDLYVSDGYGNARVHHFSADGRLIRSWGEPGTGPGQFVIPHGICVLADGRVLVCDRENDRIQVFASDGQYMDEWPAQRPTHLVLGPDGLLYVAELWWRKGLRTPKGEEVAVDRYGRLSVLDQHGRGVSRFGGGAPNTPGSFTAPHGIAVDSRGDVYVAEVTWTLGVSVGAVHASAPTLQKLRLR
jgi:DNA-binding beta-propeller fold protein YncE